MKVKERKGWKKLNSDFQKWYSNGHPDWSKQRKWLSKELVVRGYIQEEQLPEMWVTFKSLTSNCSDWAYQSQVLSLITLCLNEEIGEDLHTYFK